MSWLLRSWTDSDVDADREISQAIYPEYQNDPNHPAWFPAQQLGAPSEYSSRYVAVDTENHHPLGYATLWELRPRRYRFDLAVRPEWQGRGIASQFVTWIMHDAQTLGATGLQARVRDDKPRALEFVSRRGFKEVHRMGAYRIDFAKPEEQEGQKAFAKLRDQGIEVTNLAALRQQDPHYLERFYELYSAAREGWPDPDPDPDGSAPVPRQWLQLRLDEVPLPESFLIARLGHRDVAFTSFFGIGTGVHPEFRRRGIATLLKAGSIVDAQGRGFRGQTTSTASPGMQAVLEKLGYRRVWSEIRLIREMV